MALTMLPMTAFADLVNFKSETPVQYANINAVPTSSGTIDAVGGGNSGIISHGQLSVTGGNIHAKGALGKAAALIPPLKFILAI